jgi:hypothetical protein
MLKKSLKIAKGESVSVNRRRTYKTMTTKSAKGKINTIIKPRYIIHSNVVV